MRNVHTTINRYYRVFESYEGVFSPKSLLLWAVMVSSLLSFTSTFWLAGFIQIEKYIQIEKVSSAVKVACFLFFSILAFFSWLKVLLKKDNFARRRAQIELQTNEEKLWKLEEMWLRRYLPYKPSEYLSLAEDIDKSLSLREKYASSDKINARKVMEHIFANESKARVLAMFLMFCASIVALSIKGGATIETVFSFYENATRKELVTIFLIFPAVSYVFYVELKIITAYLAMLIERGFERLDGKSAYSKRKAKIFINVLVRYFAFEKPRERVELDLKPSIVNKAA
ncbi:MULTISPECIES: hypothetical protein [unclassified Pseudoalteromonas]|uniref:hypothetical protein n=1 Tax=unclassified Pseudoalteromonas TaxID=194690 RepID=UPI001F23CDAF|nr:MULTISPECIES: hypothetical protein [unclassified Pseudoalteromonas]MCF2828660.1 hypothetical protein [Pseudoalteromonas sp. OF5H-5]MCF2832107.1 hypothetical protein [Pseudoalteromonas sp. DL2-H6]MCF2925168.1 hypothetical protein [Pseudoalteromonas sp. DL2-H1]